MTIWSKYIKIIFFFKQKTAYEMRISDWSSDVCTSDLGERLRASPPRAVATLARGSSDNAATFARYLIETRVGVLTSSAAPSIASVYAAAPDKNGRASCRERGCQSV